MEGASQTLPPSVHAVATRYGLGALATLAVAVLAWPFDTITPGIDGDWNWVAALVLAAKDGLHFGEEVIWTYGPLGFLDSGPLLYYSSITLVTIVYQTILQLLLAGTVLLAARRSYPAVVAFVLAVTVVMLAPVHSAVVFIWAVLALTRRDEGPPGAIERGLPAAIGVLVGILLLGKINVGFEVLVLASIALVARPGARPRDAAIFAGALLAAAATGWIATGQAVGDVWPYLRYSVEIVAGYAAAMGIADPQLAWHYWIALLTFTLASFLIWDAARDVGRRQRLGLAALWLVYSYVAYKAGFVRHDGHAAHFMAAMMLAMAVVPVRGLTRLLPFAGIAVCAVVVTSIRQVTLLDELDPHRNAQALVEQVGTLASSDRRKVELARRVQRIGEHYQLPQALVDEIGARTVAFWPHVLADLPYAYGFDWRPLPVLEPYAAYTPALDAAGAEMLSSPAAPERIVRSGRPPIDGRLATFEAPVTTRAILCRYRQLASAGPWQLLARGSSRCGTPRMTATVDARWGQSVAVPSPARPDVAVLVAIDGTGPAGIERLKALWLRPDPRTVQLDGRSFRLVGATASEGLLLSVPSSADYPSPYALAPNPDTIAVSRSGSGQPGGTLRYTFLELPIEPPATIEAG